MALQGESIRALQKKILGYFMRKGRNLAFRKTRDPYKIAVAEIMLQQTQVDRVLPFWKRWVRELPDWQSLSRASTKKVLRLWSGLGYNRRALYLRDMAKSIVGQYGGKLPKDPNQLQALPGIGPYTARSILIFAFNAPLVTIDTNIRKALIHELRLSPKMSAKKLEKIAQLVLPYNRSRDWHNALMDWAAAKYPKQHPTIKPLSQQSKFVGSLRQIRGVVIRELTKKNHITLQIIQKKIPVSTQRIIQALTSLEKDRFVEKNKDSWQLIK